MISGRDQTISNESSSRYASGSSKSIQAWCRKKLRTVILLCKFRCTVKKIMTILSICLSQVLLKFALFPLCFLCVLRNKSHVRFYWLKSLILICSNYLEASRQAVIIYRNEEWVPHRRQTKRKTQNRRGRAINRTNASFISFWSMWKQHENAL